MKIDEYLKQFSNAAVALSGGVDSAYLLYECKKSIKRVKAYIVKSQFQPDFEIEDAVEICNAIGAEYKVIKVDILNNNKVIENDKQRCYYCKCAIFNTIKNTALADGFDNIFEGTNASDDLNDRPGVRALKELNVLSPLLACGITKAEIREKASEYSISVCSKPSYACLATRVPTGTQITQQKLDKVNGAEQVMFDLGFTDFRVRYLNGDAKVQLKQNQMADFLQKREQILNEFASYFDNVYLDLKAR